MIERAARIVLWMWNAPRRYLEWCLAEIRREDAEFEALSDEEQKNRIADEWP